MESTFLQHKPVFYSGSVANIFLIMLLLHIVVGVIAPLSSIMAILARTGGRLRIRCGTVFAWSMIIVALTGIVLDVVRLSFFVQENHTKYAGYSMPSTYPVRLAFLFAGLCVLYIVREVAPPRTIQAHSKSIADMALPSLLVVIGIMFTAIITMKLNPWTGSLWMIWTFILIVIIIARISLSPANRMGLVAQHRFGMGSLAAFSWWGAFEGFGPAIAIAAKGNDLSTGAYFGNQPGAFSPRSFLFLVGWAPFFCLAAYLIHRFTKFRHT